MDFPIETEEGWILLTHGVGPMRQYWMGALLLISRTHHACWRWTSPC